MWQLHRIRLIKEIDCCCFRQKWPDTVFPGAAQLSQSANVLILLSRADPAKLSGGPDEQAAITAASVVEVQPQPVR